MADFPICLTETYAAGGSGSLTIPYKPGFEIFVTGVRLNFTTSSAVTAQTWATGPYTGGAFGLENICDAAGGRLVGGQIYPARVNLEWQYFYLFATYLQNTLEAPVINEDFRPALRGYPGMSVKLNYTRLVTTYVISNVKLLGFYRARGL